MILDPSVREPKYIIFATIFMLSNRLQTIGDSFFAEVTTKQWFVILVLGIMQDYSPTLNELSQAVGTSHQNTKQLVLKLEQKGFVTIYKDEKDARRLRIKATPKCEEFGNAYHAKSTDFMNKLFYNIADADLETTKNVMLSMSEQLERMEKDYVKE